MTLIDPRIHREIGQRMLLIAHNHVVAAIDELNALVQRMETEETASPGDMKRAVADLRSAIRTVMQERQSLEDILRKEGGTGPDAPVDFDAARDAIGRRLARLRAARDGGRVPDGTG